jgi:hypothetical protein
MPEARERVTGILAYASVGVVAEASAQSVTRTAERLTPGGEIRPPSPKRSAMDTDAETNTERQAVFAVARGDSVALTALRCRQSGAGFPRRTLNWEEGGDFQWIGRALASFRAGGHEADGSTEAVFACALAESGLSGFGVWARSRGRAVAIRDRSDVLSGEVSASNSGWRGESQRLRITPRAILPTTFSSSKDQNATNEPERIRWLEMHKLGSEL